MSINDHIPMPTALPATPHPLTVEDMLSASLTIDAWLKVSKFGLTIGEDTTVFDRILVDLHFEDIQYCFAVRYGNPAIYAKTYDRVRDLLGRPWDDVCHNARLVDPQAGEFPSADVPFIARQDLRDRTGEIIVHEGDVLGHSISVTGWRVFRRFLKDAERAGIDIRHGTVRLDLGSEPQKNDKGEWGVLTCRVVEQ